ncbi:MAG: DUF2800 domain-containing protein [Gammaproteobacteria bacterium]|nr:DUF2800 domain-containing protein [Gammaproteobacteria bacterium]
MTEIAHALLGASSALRWINCPGSVRLTRDLPEQTSEFAALGSAAHELCEICLNNKSDAAAHIGEVIKVKRCEFTVDKEMADAVQQYIDHIHTIPGEPLVEVRVSYDEIVPGGFGTADALNLHEGMGYLTDYKHGAGIRVDAFDNPQLKLYALGAHQEFGFLHNIDTWRLTIVQPRLDHISEWEITTRDLLAWGEDIKPVAELALTDHAPLHPGEKQCQFCRAKLICRARADLAIQTAMEEFSEPTPKADTLSDDEVAELLPLVGNIESWCKDIRTYAMQRIEQGNPIAGYKLVNGRSIRRWVDDEIVSTTLQQHGFNPDQFKTQKLIGIGAAEKLLGGKRAAQPILEELTIKPQGKPTLVAESDKRPALIATSAEADFSKVALP